MLIGAISLKKYPFECFLTRQWQVGTPPATK